MTMHDEASVPNIKSLLILARHGNFKHIQFTFVSSIYFELDPNINAGTYIINRNRTCEMRYLRKGN